MSGESKKVMPAPTPAIPTAPIAPTVPTAPMAPDQKTKQPNPGGSGQAHVGTGKHAATKAGAYGGAEAGGMIGGIVGPPIVGNIVGGLVGERVGEAVAKETGAADAAGWANRKMADIFGQRRADKVGEMALTAFGYSESEHCICCPCMPASQILYFIFSM